MRKSLKGLYSTPVTMEYRSPAEISVSSILLSTLEAYCSPIWFRYCSHKAHGSGDILDLMAGLLIHERIRGVGVGRQSSRNVRSSSRRRSGSASMSISVIFPRATAKPITEKVGPPG